MAKTHIDLTIEEELKLLILQERIINPGFNLSNEVEAFLFARFESNQSNKDKQELQKNLAEIKQKKLALIQQQSIVMTRLKDIEIKEETQAKTDLEEALARSKSIKASGIMQNL